MSGQQCSTKEDMGEGEETANALRCFWRLPKNNRSGLLCKRGVGSFSQENKYIQENSIASEPGHRRGGPTSDCHKSLRNKQEQEAEFNSFLNI